jgi:CheY-like chemotaxis protein
VFVLESALKTGPLMAVQVPSILCIDDQETNLQIRALLLRQFGCEVFTATDEATAFEELGKHEIDVALIDYHLARGVMGDDLAREIRSRWPQMRLIMLTGDAKLPDEARTTVDAVLIKGTSNPGDMWEAIQNLLPNKKLKPRRPMLIPQFSQKAS